MKGFYARNARDLRALLDRWGYLGLLDSWAQRSRRGRWIRSLLAIHDPEDLAALDLPWWNLRATEQVAEFLASRPGARVFEWGSGASTLWLARRVAHVTSVEHDPLWALEIGEMLPDNADLAVVQPFRVQGGGPIAGSSRRGFSGLDFSDYVLAIDETPLQFDVIVVDGRAREACLVKAMSRLAPGGLIVLDNVERARYRKALAAVKGRIRVLWYFGATACLPYPTGTAVVTITDG